MYSVNGCHDLDSRKQCERGARLVLSSLGDQVESEVFFFPLSHTPPLNPLTDCLDPLTFPQRFIPVWLRGLQCGFVVEFGAK